MKTVNKLFPFVVTFILLLYNNPISAQEIVTVGLSKYTTQLKTIIEEEGFQIKNLTYNDINTAQLANKNTLCLFNLRQTWNAQSWLNASQVEAILQFVDNGGSLYITARKGYENLFHELGVYVWGNDGKETGRDWPLILEEITSFTSHPISQSISKISTDVSAKISVDNNWIVIGSNKDNIPMLVSRDFGQGKVVIGSGERIFRDSRTTSNRYESDITIADNHQFHVNLLHFLNKGSNPDIEVSNTDNSNDFTIFPNPTNDKIAIVGASIEKIELISLQGQLLKSFVVQQQKQTEIDLSQFPSGIYYIRIKTPDSFSTKEVVRR